MFSKKIAEQQPNALADQAAQSADHAIKATKRVANETLDNLAGSVQDIRQHAAPLLNRVGEQAGEMAQRSVDAIRDGSEQVRATALRASDTAVGYIREEPVKAVLIAAATGAALMAMLSLMTRSSGRG